MDIWLWLTGAMLISVGAVCGTMYGCEKMRCKALADYDFRGEKAYKQIVGERDKWIAAYMTEHAEKESLASTVKVQRIVIKRADERRAR